MFPFNDSEQFQSQEEYCFSVTASNDSFIAQIEGIIILGIIIQNVCHAWDFNLISILLTDVNSMLQL